MSMFTISLRIPANFWRPSRVPAAHQLPNLEPIPCSWTDISQSSINLCTCKSKEVLLSLKTSNARDNKCLSNMHWCFGCSYQFHRVPRRSLWKCLYPECNAHTLFLLASNHLVWFASVLVSTSDGASRPSLNYKVWWISICSVTLKVHKSTWKWYSTVLVSSGCIEKPRSCSLDALVVQILFQLCCLLDPNIPSRETLVRYE